jgi:hypothetical protein
MNETKSKALKKSKYISQTEAESVRKVKMGIEVDGELLLSGPLANIYHGYIALCESKSLPRKRKAPVETAHNERPKKKARNSPTKELLDYDVSLPSLANSTIPAPRTPLDDAPPSSPDAANPHLKHNVVGSPEGIAPLPNKSKRTKKAVTSCGDENLLEAELSIEAAEPGREKKSKSKIVPVVELEDDTAVVDASLAVPRKDVTRPYKLKPVIELTKRHRKKVVQSDEDVDFTNDAFGESEDELLIQSTNTRGKATISSKNPASKGSKEGKKKASNAKHKPGATLAAQVSGPGLVAEAPEQPDPSIDGAQDVPQADERSLFVPHDLALAESNPPFSLLRDTNKPSNKPPSANPPTVASGPPKPQAKRPSMEHTIPKRRDSMTSILQRAGLHAPLPSSRLTVPAAARIAPLHFNRKTPPPPLPPVPKPKKKAENEEETDEEEYLGLSERQIARLKEEKRKRAWYSP